MIPYARLKPGRNFKPGRAALYYAQRLVTAPAPRAAVAQAIATSIKALHRPATSLAASPAAERSTDILRSQGCTSIDPVLSPAQLERTLKYLSKAPVVPAGSSQSYPLDELPPGTAMASYPLRTVLECDELLQAANNPFALSVANAYLGCTPTISSLSVRWTFPNSGKPAVVQAFHRDCDDWRFLKMFIYLTDVDEGTGPHTYVRGTHKKAARLFARPYSDDEAAHKFGRDQFEVFLGQRGSSFMCDTYGVHKGEVPTNKPRLIFLVQYSVLPVYAFDYHKVAIDGGHNVDRYMNRLIVA